MIKDEDSVLIVDGFNLFTRHYIAHPSMTKNGEQSGGVIGFINNITRFVEKFEPNHIFVIWESGGSAKKRNLYKEYKSGSRPQKLNRYYEDEIPDSLRNRNYQIATLIKLLDMLPVEQFYAKDCEADDVIGYLCKYRLGKNKKIILSADHDYYQLLNNKTIIWSPTVKGIVNTRKVIERFGIHPNNFCLAKCVIGDNSDNIPGVKGVSYKSLIKYFPKFSKKQIYDFEEFKNDIDQLEKIKKIKKLKSLKTNTCLIERNLQLVKLDVHNLNNHNVKMIDDKLKEYNRQGQKINFIKVCLNEGLSLNPDHIFYIMKTLKR